ncbi:MAG: hypothetical protein ACE5FL_16340 [Myxococcota bacterium]
MRADGAFRFLSVATALVLWVGAVAIAGETTESEEGQTPAAEAAPPAAPDDDAAGEDAGGEAPAEESEEETEE